MRRPKHTISALAAPPSAICQHSATLQATLDPTDVNAAAARMAAIVETWFAGHQRPLPWRMQYDPYHVWVSEVMLQQTRMEVVLGGYFQRFIERFPNVQTLAAASEDEVVTAWSGLGYYRRARMLRDGAVHVVQQLGGIVPGDVETLLTVPGIGRYTAGAIASIAHQNAAPIVDGNVARIAARLFAIEAPLGSPALMRAAWLHAEQLVSACSDPRALNQGLMEIGALICRPRNPLCLTCPLQKECIAFATNRMDELPLPKAKAETRALRIPLYVITDSDGGVLMRREEGKLMTDLYHLPHGNTALLGGVPLTVIPGTLLGTVRHTVTTRRIEFEVYEAELPPIVRDAPGEYAWITDLSAVPHPSYVRKALALALRQKATGKREK